MLPCAFQFPWTIDVAPYTQQSTLDQHKRREKNHHYQDILPGATGPSEADLEPQQYSLVGIVVHGGSVSGGHYYSIIRDRQWVVIFVYFIIMKYCPW